MQSHFVLHRRSRTGLRARFESSDSGILTCKILSIGAVQLQSPRLPNDKLAVGVPHLARGAQLSRRSVCGRFALHALTCSGLTALSAARGSSCWTWTSPSPTLNPLCSYCAPRYVSPRLTPACQHAPQVPRALPRAAAHAFTPPARSTSSAEA